MEQSPSDPKTDQLSSEINSNPIPNNPLKTGEILPIGYTLEGGKYRIIQKLGEGGFGITYLAKTPKNELVVIKTLNEPAIKPEYLNKCRQDFYQEALNLARCDHHPNIVTIKTVIADQRFPCLVMEYIPGLTLERTVEAQTYLSEQEALTYIRQIGHALSAVHQRNYLHRDVKPQNIIIHQDKKEAILIDFGIARNFDPNQTRQHTAFVSKGYTPIEQIYAYDEENPPGYYTDVYGLAATLYYSLTQTKPIDSLERFIKINKGETDPLPSPKSLNPTISDQTNDAILKGLKVHYQYRPSTINHWLALLPDISLIQTNQTNTFIPTETLIQPHLIDPTVLPKSPSIQPQSSSKLIWGGIGLLALIVLTAIGFLGRQLGFLTSQPNHLVESSYLKTNTCLQNLCLSYPNDWKLHSKAPNSFDPILAELIAPDQPNFGNFSPKIVVEQYGSEPSLSLTQLTLEAANNIKTQLNQAKIIESQEITIDNYPAYRLVYMSKDNQADIKRMQLGILQQDTLYLVTYEATINEYATFEPVAENIINSLTLSP